MLTKMKFQNLSKEQKEKAIAAFFKLKFPAFQLKSGVDFDVPAGFKVRAAALLTAADQREVIKKIFVILEEFNTYISKVDVDTIMEYVEQLHHIGAFSPERDEFWLVSNQKWDYEAYAFAKGKIVLMDLDTMVEGVNKILDKEDKKAAQFKKTLHQIGLSV